MSINDEIFKKIKDSIDAAKEVAIVKSSIISDITNVLNMLSDATDGIVKYKIEKNTRTPMDIISRRASISSDNIAFAYVGEIFLSSNSMAIFGYSIDQYTGYPVTIETDIDEIECVSSEELKLVIAEKISNPMITSWVVSMMNSNQKTDTDTDTNQDIPF